MLALAELGHPTTFAENEISPTATNLLFGWQTLHTFSRVQLPERSILYNLEQYAPDSEWFVPPVTALMARFPVWDYSIRNVEAIRAANIAPRIFHAPIGTMPGMTRIPKAPVQDIDVLFYGSVNDRRRRVLRQLQEAGLRVCAAYLYGKERDAVIARSKVVINIKQQTSDLFEIVRVSYLLANRKAVVSECYETTEIDAELRRGICPVTIDGFAAACRRLVAQDDERRELEALGHEIISRRRQSDILPPLLDSLRSEAR